MAPRLVAPSPFPIVAVGVLLAALLSAYVLLAAPLVSTTPATVGLVREPYLQKVSATEATIVWASVAEGPAEVRYRLAGTPELNVAAATTTLFTAASTGMAFDYYQHEATLTALTASTTYDYDVFVGGSDATAVTDQLTTAPAIGSGTVRFVVFGDSGSGSAPQRRVADLIAADSRADRWDLALHVGDVAYPKSTYPLLHERFFDVYAEWLRRRPIFLAIGNHEDAASVSRPYLDLFALPENGANPRYPDHRERYYSFDYGPVHFIALDTQLAMGGARRQEQLNWLAADLEATSQLWRIVFFHIPIYGSSDFASDLTARAALQPIFERYGVQLVLAGHEHDYARGAPWAEGANYSPVMHVVSGGGGASLNEPTPGPWLVRWARAYHYLRGSVSDCASISSCELTLQTIDEHGVQLDAFTLPLRGQQRDAAPPEVDWIEPLAGAVLADVVTVAAAAADDEQIVKVDLLVDGGLRLVDDQAPFEFSWDTTDELNGDRGLELRALDIAGNWTVSAPRVVHVSNTDPTVRLWSPVGIEKVFRGLPYTIRWAAEPGANALTALQVSVAPDGRTFQPVPECADLPVTTRECVWTTPGPLAKRAVVRVTVVDSTGNEATDESEPFEIRTGTPAVALKFPNARVVLGLGSTQSLSWSSPLGIAAAYQVDLSRDAGSTWEAAGPIAFGLTNDQKWTVTAPATTQGLVRVKAINVPLEDVSANPFTIADPTVVVTSPSASTIWTPDTQAKVGLRTNLGFYDRFNVRLSTDGGASFPVLLAASVAGNQRVATVAVPALPTAAARILVESIDRPEWRATSKIFTIASPE